MKRHEFKYELGLHAQDIISGFKGIIVYRANYITGCDNYGLEPSHKQGGDKADTRQFDETRIKILDLGRTKEFGIEVTTSTKTKEEKKPGGPQPSANKSRI